MPEIPPNNGFYRGKKVLVTGGGGFVGFHVARALVSEGAEVVCSTSRGGRTGGKIRADELYEEIRVAALGESVRFETLDITDGPAARAMLLEIRPDALVHLAAMSHVGKSFESEALTKLVNVDGTRNLLEAAAECGMSGPFLFTSSAEVYDFRGANEKPLDENSKLSPRNPYGASKLEAERVALEFREKRGIDVIVVRPFNHVGPYQTPNFVVSEFAWKIAGIERGVRDLLDHGYLGAKRDFAHVSDVVRAYLALISSPRNHCVYNVATGEAHEIEEVLETLKSLAKVKIETRTDEGKFRPSETPVLVGSSARLASETGWTAETKFEDVLADTLEFYRALPDELLR
ncbi:MAG: GDP-mannose 4,6-dehydratase [Planctomycetes bacterium]|nr:GDP-mannose 4,6-dehydratase [Planctomycetota bacterium]